MIEGGTRVFSLGKRIQSENLVGRKIIISYEKLKDRT